MIGGSADNDTRRIEAFSDGVFAIAITLLVIEIGVPHTEGEGTLLGALLGQWPYYLGYVISFLQIGVIWANHHNRFHYIARSDHLLLFLTILFLMCVAFILFTTALLSEYLPGSEAERTIVGTVYGGTLAVTAVFFTLLWLYAAGNYRLVDRNLDPVTLRAMTRRYLAGTVSYFIAFALAFVRVTSSLVLIVVLALIFVLPEPEGRTKDSAK